MARGFLDVGRSDLVEMLFKATLVAILGGVLAYSLSFILTPLTVMAGGMSSVVTGLLLVVAIFALGKHAKIDDMSFVNILAYLIAIGTVGTLMAVAVPQMSIYILSVSDFSLLGLGWTVVYVMLAEMVLSKLKL